MYETKRAIVHRTGSGGFRELNDDTSIARIMWGDEDNIIIRTAGYNYNDSLEGASIARLQYPDFYRYNVRTGRQRRILRANARFGGYELDQQGNPRFASELDRGTQTVSYFWRPDPEDPDWQEVMSWSLTDYEQYGDYGVNVVGFDPDDSSRAYVLAHNGENTIGAHIMDMNTGEYRAHALSAG